MDFLKDPRFSEYRSSTTMTKYFPINILTQSQVNQNIIYKLLKSNEIPSHQQHSVFAEKKKIKQNQRKSTIQLTDNKFFIKKTSQRIQTINSYIQLKKYANLKQKGKFWEKRKIQSLKKEIFQLNQLTIGVQKFHKSIKAEKKKANLLKSYKNMVQNHFERFQFNEDRTRKQIVDHEEIIKLLLAKNSDDDNVAYFNVVQNKKLSDDPKNRSKSYVQNSRVELSKNPSKSIFDMRMNEYQAHCEQKISQAIDSLKKNNSFNSKPFKENNMRKINVKNCSFSSFKKYKENQNRFCKLKRKSPSDKQNIRKIKTLQSQDDASMKKTNMKNRKKYFQQTQKSQFGSFIEAKQNPQQIDLRKNMLNNSFYQGKQYFQKRIMTAGPLQSRQNMYEPQISTMLTSK